jgi:hypothetical protein
VTRRLEQATRPTLASQSGRLRPSPSGQHSLAQEDLDALPAASGVHEIYGDSVLPLYIGKSINLRARLLPAQARAMSQTWQTFALACVLVNAHAELTQSPLLPEERQSTRQRASWHLPNRSRRWGWGRERDGPPGISSDH